MVFLPQFITIKPFKLEIKDLHCQKNLLAGENYFFLPVYLEFLETLIME